MNQLVTYQTPEAILAARKARGYPSIALDWHLEAQERRARMQGPVVEPPPVPRRAASPPAAFHPELCWAARFAEAHETLDILAQAFVRRGDIVRRTVAREWGGTSLKAMLGPSRSKIDAEPRMVAMFLLRTLFAESFPKIGRAFNGRDHTTVLHGFRSTASRMAADPDFRLRVEVVRRAVEATLDQYGIGRVGSTRHVNEDPADEQGSRPRLPAKGASSAASLPEAEPITQQRENVISAGGAP